MTKKEFENEVKDLLDGLSEIFADTTKENEKDDSNTLETVLKVFKGALKEKEDYKITIETINNGRGISSKNEIKRMSIIGAIMLLDTFERIKEDLYEKLPDLERIYNSPFCELLLKLNTAGWKTKKCNDCDGDCDDDE